jgi:hypothetical protein
MPRNPSARKDDDSFRPAAQEGNRSTGSNGNRSQSTRARGTRTICLRFDPQTYGELVQNQVAFRRHVDAQYARHPELFPVAMAEGYRLHDIRPASQKLGVRLRRIELKATGAVYSLCPSFVMPYMSMDFHYDIQGTHFLTRRRTEANPPLHSLLCISPATFRWPGRLAAHI